MVKYIVKYHNDHIKAMEVKGHASSDHGNDIVCASISTAIIVTMNAIDKLKLIDLVTYDLKDGFFKIQVDIENEIINSLLENLEFTLDDLKLQYPEKLVNKE